MKRVKTLNTSSEKPTPVDKPSAFKSRLVNFWNAFTRDSTLPLIVIFGVGVIVLLVLLTTNSANN